MNFKDLEVGKDALYSREMLKGVSLRPVPSVFNFLPFASIHRSIEIHFIFRSEPSYVFKLRISCISNGYLIELIRNQQDMSAVMKIS